MSSTYWFDALDGNNMNYPYVKIPNDDSINKPQPTLENEITVRMESDKIRHSRFEKNLLKTPTNLNTIVKIFENSLKKTPNQTFIQFRNHYFSSKIEIPDDLIKYTSYTYSEIAYLAKRFSQMMQRNKLFTKSIHEGKKLNIIALETSQNLESIVTFLGSYYSNFTNLLFDEKLLGEEIYKILCDAEIESIYCSNQFFLKLVKYLSNLNLESETFRLGKLKLSNVVFYESSNKVDEEIFEFLEKNLIICNVAFFWEMVNHIETNQEVSSEENEKIILGDQPTTPALIVHSSIKNYKGGKLVVITHQALINKMLGFFFYFQKTFFPDYKDKIAFTKNISNLDSLCIFILGIQLNSSIVFLENENHILCNYIKEKIRPNIVLSQNQEFLKLFRKAEKNLEDPMDIQKSKISLSKTFGDSIKVIIVNNQNEMTHSKLIKIKMMCPFQLIISQGYREETIGSVLLSFINNLVSGNFGLVLPCYEAKIVKDARNLHMLENLDKTLNIFSGNLHLRSEALFSSYYKRYDSNSLENDWAKEDLNFLKFCEINNQEKWLITHQIAILATNRSFKILDRYEDVLQNSGFKKLFKFSFLKSFLLNKELDNFVNDVEISFDEYDYELNVIYKVDIKNWQSFLEYFLKEKVNEFELNRFIRENMKNECAVIYDKHENYLNFDQNSSIVKEDAYDEEIKVEKETKEIKDIKILRECVKKSLERNFEYNYIYSVKDINKVVVVIGE
jgi:acyl-CoA synthetase (AMP-forming)/AMP-acid ligase II